MPTITLICPSCRATISLNGMPGKQVVCPECGRIFPAPATGPKGDAWYYARGQQTCGPVSLSELRQLVEAGVLGPTDMVLQEGSTRWGPISTIPELVPVDVIPAAPRPVVLPVPASPVPVPAPPQAPSAPADAGPVPWWRNWMFPVGAGGGGLGTLFLLGAMLSMQNARRHQRDLFQRQQQQRQQQQAQPRPLQPVRVPAPPAGPGWTRCEKCRGSGNGIRLNSACPECRGRGWFPLQGWPQCTDCLGSGRGLGVNSRCFKCGGQGWFPPPPP